VKRNETEVLTSARFASKLGRNFSRIEMTVSWPANGKGSNVRHVWIVEGPGGVVAFQASPIAGTMEASKALMAGTTVWDKVAIDGVPWVGWDLGYHTHEKKHEYTHYNERCFVNLDEPCWHDGTALGAENLLEAWIAANCNDEIIYEKLEELYPHWIGDPGER
jgi:hypothetical protein